MQLQTILSKTVQNSVRYKQSKTGSTENRLQSFFVHLPLLFSTVIMFPSFKRLIYKHLITNVICCSTPNHYTNTHCPSYTPNASVTALKLRPPCHCFYCQDDLNPSCYEYHGLVFNLFGSATDIIIDIANCKSLQCPKSKAVCAVPLNKM